MSPPIPPPSLYNFQSRLSIVYVTLLLEWVRNMAEADDTIDTSAQSSLPVDAGDVRDMIEGAEPCPRDDEGSGETEGLRYVAVPLLYHLLPRFRS